MLIHLLATQSGNSMKPSAEVYEVPLKVSTETDDQSHTTCQIQFKEHWEADGGNGGFFPGKIYYEDVKLHLYGVPSKVVEHHKKYKWRDTRALEIMKSPCISWHSSYLGTTLYCPLTKILSIKEVKYIRVEQTITTTGVKLIKNIY